MLGWPIYGQLGDDTEALYDAYSEGKLLPQSAKLSRQLAQLTRKLAGIAEPKEKGFLRMFGKD